GLKLRPESVVPGTGFHLAFAASTRAQVDQFHAAALQHGGKDNGPPGLRPEYEPNYYAAFVIDPDGYRIEAVTKAAEKRRGIFARELLRGARALPLALRRRPSPLHRAPQIPTRDGSIRLPARAVLLEILTRRQIALPEGDRKSLPDPIVVHRKHVRASE